MFELIIAGGWVMIPILLCSVVGLAIVGERFWALRVSRVAPTHLLRHIWQLYQGGRLDAREIQSIRDGSPLGRVLAAGLANLRHDRAVMKESIEDAGRQVVLELERYLNTLGTIAAASPLLGLLGTVLGMINVFNSITTQGVGDAGALAGGISEALITTAAGLFVAIPALMFYRYFRGKVEVLVLRMEEEALKLVEVIHGERERNEMGEAA